MDKKPDILDAIKGFVERPRRADVADRVSNFLKRASGKGDVVETPVIEVQTPDKKVSRREEVVLEFFAPVGFRPLFEQEIVFLMNEGVSYADIMRMPIYLRKRLIDQKVGKETEAQDIGSDPLYAQARAAREAAGEPEPTNARQVEQ